ncbi:TetR/AcrR family transcriptional regulator (plasmid) [Streptomyces sp. NBC_01003]|uniref:TetR/AcrR family transcriptional regulator n=1 Tax=Streptomyces sp. NBC_01003 TaxID=2903714 RepID=UPI002F907CD3|nr:TetR/AcrR family transcriptional regulator [Streptomyces sp. NBC_01003]WSW31017.1 TetR/AcrR family transcriptional regulator [Streptomyces sp. NBC_01003]
MGDTSTTAAALQGRRERNRLRVKNRICETALLLFTRQGYDQTTVDEITEAADVARGTFFNHFQRKEDPIAEWGEQRRELLRQGLRAEGLEHPHGKDTRHTLSRCMSILAGSSQENPAQTKAVLTAWVRAGFPLHEQPYVSGMFTDFIKAEHGTGQVPDTVDTQLTGYLMRDICLGTLYRWSQSPQ